MQTQISVEQIRAAREIVYCALKPTPLIEYPLLAREIGARVFFNAPAKGFSTHSESSSLGREEFGIAESSRQ